MKTPVNIDLAGDDERPVDEIIVDEEGALASKSNAISGIVDEDINPLDKLPEEAIRNTDGSVTLPLLFPATVLSRKGNGELRTTEYAELRFYRLNGADLRAIANAKESDGSVVSFSRATKINQAIMNALFDKMDGADITRCGKVLNHFLTSGPKTGR